MDELICHTRHHVKRLFFYLIIAAATSSCGTLKQDNAAVVYALGSRDGFTSPLAGNLTPACPALSFVGDHHTISGRHLISLRKVADQSKQDKTRLLIAGYTSPKLPQDYARSLSERRAQDVRQHLIEMGVEAGSIHTLGLGNDFSPSGPSSDVVVIYHATPRSTSGTAESPSSN
jgi:hypothetical protein